MEYVQECIFTKTEQNANLLKISEGTKEQGGKIILQGGPYSVTVFLTATGSYMQTCMVLNGFVVTILRLIYLRNVNSKYTYETNDPFPFPVGIQYHI